MQRRLTGGVGCADDVHVVALGPSGVAGRRAVVHTPPGELGEPVASHPAIRHAGRDHHGAGLDLGPVGEAHGVDVAALLERLDASREHHLGAEPLGLHHRPLRQVGTAQAVREAEVVLDARALCRLATGASRSMTAVCSPSDAPYTAAARPAGPAPTTTRS